MSTTKIHYRGQWAVVMGASSGSWGCAIAGRLAEAGQSPAPTGCGTRSG